MLLHRGRYRPGRRRLRALARLAALVLVARAPPGSAAIISAAGDDESAQRSERDFAPAWQNVAARSAYSAVYLGRSWMLTAAHVGAGPVRFAGPGAFEARAIAGSEVRLRNADASPSDVLAFRIAPAPPLPGLALVRKRPRAGHRAVLVGNGFERGAPFVWRPRADALPVAGWHWSARRRLLWGTNRLDAAPASLEVHGVRTRVLAMTFDPPDSARATPREAQVAVGDSGGGLFVREPGASGGWELAGILILSASRPGQPPRSALFGNRSFAADLSAYRPQLLQLLAPACSDGRDNDGDRRSDFPADPGCLRADDDSERGPADLFVP